MQETTILRGNIRYIYTPMSYGHSRCLVPAGTPSLSEIKAQTVLSRSRIGNAFHRCGDHVRVIWTA